jgi:hypothetical protein
MLNSFTPTVLEDAPHYVQCTDNRLPVVEYLLNETTHCSPNYLVLECGCGRRPIVTGCQKNNCTFCQKHNTKHRADAVMKRIIKSGHNCGSKIHYPRMIYTVFTIPMHLRAKYYDRAELKKLTNEIWKVLSMNFDGRWGALAIHPISEKNPEVFHPHINFLWMQNTPGAEYIDVEELKRQYGIVIGYNGLPDIRTQYSNKPAKLWKWCEYIFRVFPQFNTWLGNIRYYGKRPKLDKKEVHLCPVCQLRINAIGRLTPEGIRKFLESDPPTETGPPEIDSYYIDFFGDF